MWRCMPLIFNKFLKLRAHRDDSLSNGTPVPPKSLTIPACDCPKGPESSGPFFMEAV